MAERTDARTRAYDVETRLPDGRQALLFDIGSVGNLAGDQWVQLCKQLLLFRREGSQSRGAVIAHSQYEASAKAVSGARTLVRCPSL